MNEKLIEMAKTAGFVQEGTTMVVPSIEELERFAELIREDERQSQWQPIETFDKARVGDACYENHSKSVFLGSEDSVVVGHWDWHSNGKRGNWKERSSGRVLYSKPTHWQHLPKPPKEQ